MAKKTRENKAARGVSPAPRRMATTAVEGPRGRRSRAGAASPYHHGALKNALLEAAERVLERDGLAGLTLRAAKATTSPDHSGKPGI